MVHHLLSLVLIFSLDHSPNCHKNTRISLSVSSYDDQHYQFDNNYDDNYRFVVFEDLNNGAKFLTRSTVAAEETTKWEDGQEYPLVKVHISSASHPFFTGEERVLDIEGRVDKFKNRREAAAKALAARKKSAAKVRVKKTDDEAADDK